VCGASGNRSRRRRNEFVEMELAAGRLILGGSVDRCSRFRRDGARSASVDNAELLASSGRD
jgi:hypothetical protein